MQNWIGNIKGRTTLGIGLTIEDIEKLIKGNLVFATAENLGVPFDVAVHYGKDVPALLKQLTDAGIEINEGGEETSPLEQ